LLLGGLLVAATSFAQGTDFTNVQRGRYLANAGDCISCHTVKGGKPYAGGYPVETPFGTI
jgi:mono/diheme cytochrome c family protein